MVEHDLAKVGVAGPSPVSRSRVPLELLSNLPLLNFQINSFLTVSFCFYLFLISLIFPASVSDFVRSNHAAGAQPY